jgi:hypothetical protein
MSGENLLQDFSLLTAQEQAGIGGDEKIAGEGPAGLKSGNGL